jgi:hypothetical protein
VALALTPVGGHLLREMSIMKSQRRAFTPEFKDEAVNLVVNTGRPITSGDCYR